MADGPHNMNPRWWSLRLQHQGIVPPVPRNETHFDPAAKYHVAADQPYIRFSSIYFPYFYNLAVAQKV